jgi:uncharacterized protein with PIN domain
LEKGENIGKRKEAAMASKEMEAAMDRTVEEFGQLLLEGGKRDLRATRLTEMEDETDEIGLELIRRLLAKTLALQAEQAAEVECCPRCGGALTEKEDEEKPLMMRRGKVQWQQPVRRCTTCRRDFFPSVPGLGD